MKNKSFFLALTIIILYVVIIKPFWKKTEEQKKEEQKKKEDNTIKSDNNVAGFDYSLIDDDFMEKYNEIIGDTNTDTNKNNTNKNNSNGIPADNSVAGAFAQSSYTL